MSTAFFKSKISNIVQTIKEMTVEHLKVNEKEGEINLPAFTMEMQAKIIVAIALGPGMYKTLFPYECEDGSIV
jgi:hypothetical protein